MNALLYLIRTKLKNQFKELLRKPARLIYVLVLLVCFAFMLSGNRYGALYRDYRDIRELMAIAFAVYVIVFLLNLDSGFSRGGGLFRLSDVNFMFTAPLRPQLVLFYGLFQQLTASLLIGFFLLFQYSWLNMTYGVTVGQLLCLLLGYAAAAFLGQVTAVALYAFTSASEQRQRVCRVAIYGLTACLLGYALFQSLRGGMAELLPRAVAVAGSGVRYLFPVAGWLTVAVGGVLTGQGVAAAGLGLCALYLAALVWVMFRTNPDFYEDVIKSAEVSQSAINARREGTMTEAAPLRVHLGRTGLKGGQGASVIFYKHQIENRRTRKFLLGTNALIFAIMTIGFAVFTRKAGLLPTFVMATYTQIFTTLMGRLNQELRKPYLYLIPEPPLIKLLWTMAELLPAALLESLVIFVPVGILLGLTPVEGALCVLARLSFALLFSTANLLVERLWGGVTSPVLVRLLILAVALGLALPSVVLAFIAALVWGFTAAGVLGVLAVCNLPIALLALLLCRDMLQYAELNQQ